MGLGPLLAEVAGYYGDKVQRHGATPHGADWTCEPTQQLRFVQLLKIVDGPRFTLNDLGCGYGALLPFMRRHRRAGDFDYLGLDIAPAMVSAARALHGRRRNARFECAAAPSRVADYTVASGTFNVRLARSDADWRRFVAATLHQIASTTRLAFAVNFIDAERAGGMPPELYCADPREWSDWCSSELGWTATVLRGYGLREFTLQCRPAQPPSPAALHGTRQAPSA
jgi:SAM-dependent methyltransferase